jgi:hypothetical protein
LTALGLFLVAPAVVAAVLLAALVGWYLLTDID